MGTDHVSGCLAISAAWARFRFWLFVLAKVLSLNASTSRDEDSLDTLSFEFSWSCEDEYGGTCVSQLGVALDISAFSSGELLTLPAETLPTGKRQQVFSTACLPSWHLIHEQYGWVLEISEMKPSSTLYAAQLL